MSDTPGADLWLAFFDRHRAALAAYAHTLCESTDDAADLVQDVLVSMLRSHRDPRSALAYVLASMRNRVIDHARRAGRAQNAIESIRASRALAAHDDNPDAAPLSRALDALPPDQAEVVILKLRSGLTFDQIAQVLGRPVGTISSQYSRALAAMRTALQELHHDTPA